MPPSRERGAPKDISVRSELSFLIKTALMVTGNRELLLLTFRLTAKIFENVQEKSRLAC